MSDRQTLLLNLTKLWSQLEPDYKTSRVRFQTNHTLAHLEDSKLFCQLLSAIVYPLPLSLFVKIIIKLPLPGGSRLIFNFVSYSELVIRITDEDGLGTNNTTSHVEITVLKFT